jgi:List-Bact-rpt repeat protein
VTVSGPGHVTAPAHDPTSGAIDCPDLCSALIRQGSTVTFTATPDSGAQFTGWGGACSGAGTSSTCTLSIDGPNDITAGFGTTPPPPTQFQLTVAKTGTGTGYVGGAGGIDCGPTCSATFAQNAQVTLVAVADSSSVFAGWSGGGCSGTDKCSVTVTADTTVTTTFDHVDTEPPHIHTIRASAAPGALAQLRFRVYDDSGMSRELLTIVMGKSRLGRVTVPLRTVVYRRAYTARWHVPANAKPGSALYCAVAIDSAGNRSNRSCSIFTVT